MFGKTNNTIPVIFLLLIVILISFYFSRYTPSVQLQMAIPVAIAILFAFISILSNETAAICLIVSIIASPEIDIFSLGNIREVVIRLDDIFIMILFLSWLLKMAKKKNLRLFKKTPLSLPIMSYMLVLLTSTLLSYFLANLRYDLLHPLFYIVKYSEYFLVYFMFTNIIQTEKQLDRFYLAIIITAVGAALYGFWQVFEGVHRISLPFEGVGGEANTFGGYLLLILGITIFMATEARRVEVKFGYAVGALVTVYLIFHTFSRAAYMGMAVMMLFPITLAKPMSRFIVILILIAVAGFSNVFVPQEVKDRVAESFSGKTVQVFGGIRLSKRDSAYTKVTALYGALKSWRQHPIIGNGVTNAGFVDTQYPRILGEGGLVGLAAFIWMIYSVFIIQRRTLVFLRQYNSPSAWKWKAFTLAATCSLTGLLFHGLGANTFIIIRIMEPLWIITAMVQSIPDALMHDRRA